MSVEVGISSSTVSAIGIPSGQSDDIPAVTLENIARRFEKVEAPARISLSIRGGEFFSLLGPSGCGKTTLLRIIAGLDWPDEGRLLIHGQDAARIPAHRRPVNAVFEDAGSKSRPYDEIWTQIKAK